MEPHVVRVLAYLIAEQARTFGMVAENQVRVARGESPAYDEAAFFAQALHIETLAREL